MQSAVLQIKTQIPLPLQRVQPGIFRTRPFDSPRGETQQQRVEQPDARRQQQSANAEKCAVLSRENRTEDKRGASAIAAESPDGAEVRARNPVSNANVRRLQSLLELSGQFGDAVRAHVAAAEHAKRVSAAGIVSERRHSHAADVPALGTD